MRYTLVMTRVKIEYMLFAAMLLVAGAAYGRGPVVAAVGSGPWANPDLYVGEWYEIARFDHPFQEGTVGSRVVYRLLSESKMRIVYRGKDGRTGRDRISSAKGRLSADYECLRVSSFWFFYSDYTMPACDSAAERQWVVLSADRPNIYGFSLADLDYLRRCWSGFWTRSKNRDSIPISFISSISGEMSARWKNNREYSFRIFAVALYLAEVRIFRARVSYSISRRFISA